MNVAIRADTTRLAALLRRGALDTKLAAVLSILAGEGMSLVAAHQPAGGPPAEEFLAAIVPARPPVELAGLGGGARALLRAASLGSAFVATIEASSLEDVYEQLRAADAADDELSYLGLVVVLDTAGRVMAAHFVRPVALDGHGHVQRLGPAVLAAREATSDRLDHFGWGVMPELASRIRWKAGDLEAEIDRRSHEFSHLTGRPS